MSTSLRPTLLATITLILTVLCSLASCSDDDAPVEVDGHSDTAAMGDTTAMDTTDATDSAGDTGGEDLTGAVGWRCGSAGDCQVELECRSEFFFERRVCTAGCTGATDCPDGTVCVDEVPDYNGTTVGPYCLRPCETTADCEPLGSDCDTRDPLEARYCF